MVSFPDSLFEQLRQPLLENSNTVLSFDIQSQSESMDEDGNYAFDTTTISLNAIVHPKSTQDGYFEGADRKSLTVRGRLTDPLEFPLTIKHLSRGNAVIDSREGSFILHLLPSNPYVQNRLGQEFEGVFNEN
jgi:hypothetical protein